MPVSPRLNLLASSCTLPLRLYPNDPFRTQRRLNDFPLPAQVPVWSGWTTWRAAGPKTPSTCVSFPAGAKPTVATWRTPVWRASFKTFMALTAPQPSQKFMIWRLIVFSTRLNRGSEENGNICEHLWANIWGRRHDGTLRQSESQSARVFDAGRRSAWKRLRPPSEARPGAGLPCRGSEQLPPPGGFVRLSGFWNRHMKKMTETSTNWFFIYRQLLFTVLRRNGFWVINIHRVALLYVI